MLTQGSGKSLSMVFYTGKIVLALDNPTVVVITDRNDLDDQLFGTFAASSQLLRQTPKQADNREELKELLKVGSGGVIFTTIQKFQPEDGGSVYEQLSDRTNIVVIADEAHRSQYGFNAKEVDVKDENGNVVGKRTVYGFAKYKAIQESDKMAEELNLTEYEYAFYSAVADNDSARELMQKEILRELAIVLTESIRKNVTLDWTIKEAARAKLRVIVKRLLKKYGYPPDMALLATETVLEQAEQLAEELATAA